MAYDEENNRLYVGDNTTTVKYYDPNDWSKEGEFDVPYTAIGVAVDIENQYVYTGSGSAQPGGAPDYLCRHALNASDPCDVNLIVDVGSPVLGIAVDQETSLVYLTTYGEGNPDTSDRLMVYAPYDPNNPQDPNMTLMWKSGDIGNPAGVAVASGVRYKPPILNLTKTDDVADPDGCVAPDDFITYTICYDNEGNLGEPNTHHDVWLTDVLPWQVDLLYTDPNYTYFESSTNTIFWYLGDIDPDASSVCIDVYVQVSERAHPGSELTNSVEIESDIAYNEVTETTPVCCWGDSPVYVDQSATDGYNNGSSWQDAFLDLQDALQTARNCPDSHNEIWVSEGTYVPGDNKDNTFELIDGVALYGGFAGYETKRQQRNWNLRRTVLSGKNSQENCNYVVTADDVGETSSLDGFVIQAAAQAGISCTNADPNIVNCLVQFNYVAGISCSGSDPNVSYCTIENNRGVGVRCENASAALDHCILRNNRSDGLYASGNSQPLLSNCLIEENQSDGVEAFDYSANLRIEKSKIRNNSEHGILLNSSEGTILNNWIHHNGKNGIQLSSCNNDVTVRNNTIVYNTEDGIERYSGTAAPTVKNNILWGNNIQLSGTISPTYCCIQGITMPNGNNNINNDPEFAYRDPDSYNFHLDPNSACIDAGDNTDIDEGETDIDGDPRIDIVNEIVDIGADECSCDDVSNDADFNGDGIINLLDYTPWANYWLTDDSDPNWSDEYDLIDDNVINLLDLHAFCNDWLWTACYYSNDWFVMEMMMSQGGSGGIGFGKMSSMQFSSLTMMSESTEPQPQTIILTAKKLWDIIHRFEELRETDEVVKDIPEAEWLDAMRRIYLIFDYLE